LDGLRIAKLNTRGDKGKAPAGAGRGASDGQTYDQERREYYRADGKRGGGNAV